MKKSRKILAGIMAVCLMGSVATIPENIAPFVSITAVAVDTYEGLTYKIGKDNTVTITGYDKSLTDIVIPDTIEGLPVTAIGDNAFRGEMSATSKITSIKLPSTLKKIGTSAFSYCNSITSMDIPNGVTSIGQSAFSGCNNLESITIPDSVTDIGAYVFNQCTNLKEIKIPDSVTNIGDCAFYNCENLKSVTISNSITSIDECAFSGCKSLESITIPDSVTSIGQNAFTYCNSFKSVTIPDSVTSIGQYAFDPCENLTEITILNPECEIYDSNDTICNTMFPTTFEGTIYGYKNSTAQAYAEKYGYKFALIGEKPSEPATILPESNTVGDSNGDGEVNISDTVLIMQSISNPDEYKLSESAKIFADVVDKGDGITNMDALAIQMTEAKLIAVDDLPVTTEELKSLVK